MDPMSSNSATAQATTITELRKYRPMPTLFHAVLRLSHWRVLARENRSRMYSRRVFIATLAVNSSG